MRERRLVGEVFNWKVVLRSYDRGDRKVVFCVVVVLYKGFVLEEGGGGIGGSDFWFGLGIVW